MKNIKIGPKLITSFLFIAALTAFMGIYLENSLKILGEEISVSYHKGSVPLGMLVETAEQIQELRIDIRRWQLARTDEGRAEIIKAMGESAALIKEYIGKQRELVLVEVGKKILDNVQSATDKYLEEVHNYVRTSKIDSVTGLNIGDLSPEVLRAANEMSKAMDAAVERRINSTKALADKDLELAERSKNVAITLLIIVSILSLGLGIFLTTSITRPLHAVVGTISKMEKGDLTARAGLERGDELGILSKALDSLSSRLQVMFSNFQENSETIAGSAEELSSIGKQVTSATEKVTANINVMASGATQASTNADEVAGTAEEMSTNMNTIAAAVEEMSASISQIANNAGEANKIANNATLKSNEATSVMNKLGAAAKEIGQVTEVIKKIADKTNLLALNATIEAASAGESGKGFAVVAGEIKDLANQSAKSADDIAKRIDGIQSGTGEAVKVISDVSEIIAKINHSVETISTHVGQQTKASNEIANNVTQVNVGAKRVASAISEVAKGSKDMSRSAEEIARNAISSENTKQINQGADDLARLASDLKKALSHFKVGKVQSSYMI